MTENETTPGDEFTDRRLLAILRRPPTAPMQHAFDPQAQSA